MSIIVENRVTIPRPGWALAGLALAAAAGCAAPPAQPEPLGRDEGPGGGQAPSPSPKEAPGSPPQQPPDGGAAAPPVAQEARSIDPLPFASDPEEQRRGANLLHLSEVYRIPVDPLRVHNNHQLHGIFYLPPMEGAETLDEGTFAFRFGIDLSNGSARDVNSRFFYNYKGTLYQTDLQGRYGLGEGAEVGMTLDISEVFGASQRIVLARDGKELVREGDRGLAVGDAVFALKKRLTWEEGDPGGLSAALSVKIPLDRDRDNLVTSSEVDTSVQFIYSHSFGDVTAHLNAGFMIPGRDKVFLEDVSLRDPILLGIGLAWKASPDWVVLAQWQGHQSVFEDRRRSVEILDENLFSMHGGVRTRVGSYFLESSVGGGLGGHTSGFIFTLSLEMRF